MMSSKRRDPDDNDGQSIFEELADFDEQLLLGVGSANVEDENTPDVLRAKSLLRRVNELARHVPHDTVSLAFSKTSGAGFQVAEPHPPVMDAPEADLPDQIGRFHIRGQLGSGGFGIVMLAYDPTLQREVALKVPRLGALVTPDLQERFEREARAAASLDHPNIVPVHEAGRHGPTVYLVSALCRGPTLSAWQRSREEPVPHRLAAWLTSVVAEAVHHAHGRGVLHRDLKPANVMLEPLPEGARPPAEAGDFPWTPKITDFGLAKLVQEKPSDATRSQMLMGTGAYMAPEQAAGRARSIGAAADIYSLGVMLYELITGRPPLVGETELETLQLVQSSDPVHPTRVRPGTPRDLETICLKCLQKEPQKRYASAEALAEDLRRFLRREPILARRARSWERAARWCRRNPTAASLAFLVLLTALVGFSGVIWQLREANEQRRLAQQNRDRAWRAVEELLTEVGMERLTTEPQFELVRRALLEKALQFYNEFLEENADNPDVRREVARAHQRVGLMYQYLGEKERARGEFETAVTQLRKMRRASPDDESLILDLADALDCMAELDQRDLDTAAAEANYRRALELLESVSEDDPTAEYLRAHVRRGLGALLQEMGSGAESIDLYDAAIATFEQLLEADPSSRLYRDELARSLELRASSSAPVDAERLCRRAIEIYEDLVVDYPYPDYRNQLANVYLSLGYAQWMLDQKEESLASYAHSRELMLGLVRDFPDVPHYRSTMAAGQASLGWVLAGMQRWEEADDAYNEAARLLRDLVESFPNEVSHRNQLSQLLNNIGIRYVQAAGGFSTGEPQRAELFDRAGRAYEESVTMLESLHQRYPELPDYRKRLAGTLHNLGVVVLESDSPDEARPMFERAIAYQQTVLDQNSEDVISREFMGNHHYWLARTLVATDNEREAIAAYEESMRIFESLMSDHPEVPMYARRLNSAHVGATRLLLTADDVEVRDPEYAVSLMREVIQRSPDSAVHWSWLSLALLRDGRFDESLETLERAGELTEDGPSAFVRIVQAIVLVHLGQRETALAFFEEGEAALAEEPAPNALLKSLVEEARAMLQIEP